MKIESKMFVLFMLTSLIYCDNKEGDNVTFHVTH